MRVGQGTGNFTCDYCKSLYIPSSNHEGVSELEELPDRLCPICAIPLWNATIQGSRIWSCKRCGGMMIPMGGFPDLVEQIRDIDPGAEISPAAPDPRDLQRKIDCPVCHKHMEAHVYFGGGNVVIDSCENCELNWLDRGELMRISRAPKMAAASYDE
jgi:Zn-finger nucleic acid-binding protein